MKKTWTLFIVFLLLFSIKVDAKDIGILIDGKAVAFTESTGSPFADENSRTQVPLRVTMENYGALVDWDQSTQTAIVSNNGIVVKVPMGTQYIFVNDVKKEIDTKSVVVNERIYLPIRFVLEAFGASVNWDQTEFNVVITSNNQNYENDTVDSKIASKFNNELGFLYENYEIDSLVGEKYAVIHFKNSKNKLMDVAFRCELFDQNGKSLGKCWTAVTRIFDIATKPSTNYEESLNLYYEDYGVDEFSSMKIIDVYAEKVDFSSVLGEMTYSNSYQFLENNIKVSNFRLNDNGTCVKFDIENQNELDADVNFTLVYGWINNNQGKFTFSECLSAGQKYEYSSPLSDVVLYSEIEPRFYDIDINLINHKYDLDLNNLKFGSYPQNGSKDEPIEWRVLDIDKQNNKALIITEKAFMHDFYHHSKSPQEMIIWEECTTRDFLNNEFIYDAFTEEEQSRILSTYLEDVYVYDKIFLLNKEEVEEYMPTTEDRKCERTQNVKEDKYVSDLAWWLRTKLKANYTCGVGAMSGKINNSIFICGMYLDDNLIRPAMWIKVNNAEINNFKGTIKKIEVQSKTTVSQNTLALALSGYKKMLNNQTRTDEETQAILDYDADKIKKIIEKLDNADYYSSQSNTYARLAKNLESQNRIMGYSISRAAEQIDAETKSLDYSMKADSYRSEAKQMINDMIIEITYLLY